MLVPLGNARLDAPASATAAFRLTADRRHSRTHAGACERGEELFAFQILCFGFVSDFEFRIWDFVLLCSARKPNTRERSVGCTGSTSPCCGQAVFEVECAVEPIGKEVKERDAADAQFVNVIGPINEQAAPDHHQTDDATLPTRRCRGHRGSR